MQIAICSAPRPNTSRLITFRRSKLSSSPIVNNSSTTPHSAIGRERFAVGDGDALQPWRELGHRAQAGGAKRHAEQQEADYRADFDAVEYRDDRRGRAKHDERFLESGGVDRSFCHCA